MAAAQSQKEHANEMVINNGLFKASFGKRQLL
jgi:hypothetical protein